MTSISANTDNTARHCLMHIALHTECNHQAVSTESEFKAHCYTDQQLLVINTYVHGEVKTPLGRFVVDILCSSFATVTNQIDGA